MAKRTANAVWEGTLRDESGGVNWRSACRMFFDGPGGGFDEGRS